jgi:hypothetical protein
MPFSSAKPLMSISNRSGSTSFRDLAAARQANGPGLFVADAEIGRPAAITAKASSITAPYLRQSAPFGTSAY